MFNLYRTITVLFVLAIFLNIQAVENVSSVNAYQEGKNIVITYQLSKRSNISVYVSTDGGSKYHSIKNISGDFGKNVSSGTKQIIWNVLADYEKFIFSEVCFKITANEHNGHEFVDLGLPSGTKWATCNVGATKPEEYGNYFAWGEIKPKARYYWDTYNWCNGSKTTLTKYCVDSSYGRVDNKTILDLLDDAACINWGGRWRMPTKVEYDELRNLSYTTWTWTSLNGVNGYKVTSKTNGNSIFLPAAGYRGGSELSGAGSYGNYWSSSLYSSYSDGAYILYFYSGYVVWSSFDRYYGRSVRAVLRVEEP